MTSNPNLITNFFFATFLFTAFVAATPVSGGTGAMGSGNRLSYAEVVDSSNLIWGPASNPGRKCSPNYFISFTTDPIVKDGIDTYTFQMPVSGGGCYAKNFVVKGAVASAGATTPSSSVATANTASSTGSSSSPSGAPIESMTLYNLNKWPIGFAGPDGNEKDLKAYVEKEVAGKFLETPNGLPPTTDGATIRSSFPQSTTPYSLVRLNGKILDVQTGCNSAGNEPAPVGVSAPNTAAAPASGTSTAPSKPATAAAPSKTSCKDQALVTQQLVAYVLDESRELKVDVKKCSLASQPDANTACLVCGGGKVEKCPASATGGTTGGPGGASGGTSGKPAPGLPDGQKKADLEKGGYVACEAKDFNVKVIGGSFSNDPNKHGVSFTVKLKKTDDAKTKSLEQSAGSVISYSSANILLAAPAAPPAPAPSSEPKKDKSTEPSVFFTVKLIPMRNVAKNSETAEWVPSQGKVLYDGYCLNANGFGPLDSDKVKNYRCWDLATGNPAIKSEAGKSELENLKKMLTKAVDAVQTITLNKLLEITISGKTGKLPEAPAPKKVKAEEAATSVSSFSDSEVDSSSELISESMYFVTEGQNGGLSFAPAAVPAIKGPSTSESKSQNTYYLFTGWNDDKKEDSFYVQDGMAVQVKVFLRQWWDSKENVNPPDSATPVKKYCSTYLNQNGDSVGEGTGFATVNNPTIVPHNAIEGLAPVPNVEPAKPAVSPAKKPARSGSSRQGAGSRSEGRAGGGSGGGVKAAPAKPIPIKVPSPNSVTGKKQGDSCGSGRGICWSNDQCRSSLPLDGTCGNLVCCTERITR